MSKKKRREAVTDDEGVSPVIAVILMVAITVVLAATVYVWVSGFATEDTGPEQAAATAKGVDLDDNGDVEWVQVTLTSGENAPYTGDDITFSATDSNGADISDICASAQAEGGTDCDSNGDGTADVAFDLSDTSTDEWDVGENLWVPCQADGNHIVTVSVAGTSILDTTVTCGTSAA